VRCTLIVVGLSVAYAFLPLRDTYWWVGPTIGLVLLAGTLPVAVRRLRKVLASDHPMVDAVEGLVLVVAMMVVGFASLYYAIDSSHDQFNGLETRIDSLYFTVTTLSTVGFGDITATSQKARFIVTGQILIDLAFIGVAVRVFGNVATSRRKSENRKDPLDD